MNSLCGWFGQMGTELSANTILKAMLSALHGSTNVKSNFCGAAAASGGSVTSLPNGLIAVIVGHPSWSTSDLKHLAEKHSHATALAEAYQRYGVDFFHYLYGPFSLAIIDCVCQRLIAAIDRIGQHSLYHSRTSDGIVFGSSIDNICAHPRINKNLSLQGIFNYIYFHILPSPSCIYEGHQKLPGGHYLDYGPNRFEIIRYWEPKFSESQNLNLKTLNKELSEIILKSVRRWSDGRSVGAFLSGGLDSSTVAGTLAQAQPGVAKTYSIGFQAKGYDEMEYVRIAARHFQLNSNEYYVTPEDVIVALPAIARFYGEPFGNSSAVAVYYCAKLAAADGTKQLLAGDGGDELFAGNERYAKQHIFERYQYLPLGLRKNYLELMLNRLPQSLPLAGKIQSFIRQANIPLPDRLQTYNFLHRHPLQQIFSEDFLAAVDSNEPLNLQRQQFNHTETASMLNRMLHLDWQQTLADNDLRKVSGMCMLAGVEAVYPLLDDDLIAFSCRIPSNWKLKGQHLRYFYKQAMKGFLPKQIIYKSKHGFGLPFGVWMRSYSPLQELAYDSLMSLKKRHYFQPEFLDRTINLHREGHAAYYGELVWILMMLSLWLEEHGY